MEYVKKFNKRDGCDFGYHQDNLHPESGEGRVGKSGIDKTKTLTEVIKLASTMNNPRPNIIVKAGKNAKWYLKYTLLNELEEKIKKAKWNGTRDAKLKRCTMYIIEWDQEEH